MKQSIAESRDDGKPCPKVGAVLVSPDGKRYTTAYRGELREGDHAEFTLLERKHRDKDLTGYYLFATLEPCAPGARRNPKLACAERIVNARIAKVWIGIEDPDPTVDRKGILYLEQKGIEVEMFDDEFQDEIRAANKEFLASAIKRSEDAAMPGQILLSPLEKPPLSHVNINHLSKEALELYISKASLPYTYDTADFHTFLQRQEFLIKDDAEKLVPTGLCLLLFGENPRLTYPQAVVKAEIRHKNTDPGIKDFNDPLVLLPEKIETWLKDVIPSAISREHFARTQNYSYPIPVLREAIVNALVHRDYDIEQAKVYIIIEEDAITIKSPGAPVNPIKWDDFKNFKAPSLSRNPKIMSVFNQMGFVEERGIGMKEMKSLPQNYQLPLPDITMNDPYIEIVFPRTGNYIGKLVGEKIFADLNEEERNGLRLLHDRKIISKKDYARYFDYDEKKAQRHLSKFAKSGLAAVQGKGPAVKYLFIRL